MKVKGARNRGESVIYGIGWEENSRKLLKVLKTAIVGEPFLYPVDLKLFPSYTRIIDTPMDLSTVGESLAVGNYSSFRHFQKDIEIIISNSKKFTPNPNTEMHQTTLKFERLYKRELAKIIQQVAEMRNRLSESGSSSSSNSLGGGQVEQRQVFQQRKPNDNDDESSATDYSGDEGEGEETSVNYQQKDKPGRSLLYSSEEESPLDHDQDQDEYQENSDDDYYDDDDGEPTRKNAKLDERLMEELKQKEFSLRERDRRMEGENVGLFTPPDPERRKSTNELKRKSNIKLNTTTPGSQKKKVHFNVSELEAQQAEKDMLHLQKEKIRLRNNLLKSVPYLKSDSDLDKFCRPSKWLGETKVRRTPYWPQLGDDLVYFRQGHEEYLKECEKRGIYVPTKKESKIIPFLENPSLAAQISVRVNHISYVLHPPRMCILRLAVTDWNTRVWKDKYINVQFHATEDLRDFLVLRQFYDHALRKEWTPKDRCKCWIAKSSEWKFGTLLEKSVLDPIYPNSYYRSFKIHVDGSNFSCERFSAWEICKLNEKEEEHYKVYKPIEEDWNMLGQKEECERISKLLSQVMTLPVALPFALPVDLDLYPNYSYMIEYPCDLSKIKERLKNLFYRRKSHLIWDVSFIFKNAKKFNLPESEIVKHARIVDEMCLRIINCPTEKNVIDVFNKIVESEATRVISTTSPSNSNDFKKKWWCKQCEDVIEMIFLLDDAKSFRVIKRSKIYADYIHIIKNPIDMFDVQNLLKQGKYSTVNHFHNDMTRVFNDALEYFIDKDSRIYGTVLKLQNTYKGRIISILNQQPSSSSSSIIKVQTKPSTLIKPKIKSVVGGVGHFNNNSNAISKIKITSSTSTSTTTTSSSKVTSCTSSSEPATITNNTSTPTITNNNTSTTTINTSATIISNSNTSSSSSTSNLTEDIILSSNTSSISSTNSFSPISSTLPESDNYTMNTTTIANITTKPQKQEEEKEKDVVQELYQLYF